jgi:hypothetical protein
VRYVKMHGSQIPHEGRGRRRRYRPEALEVFSRLRAESPRGGRRRAGGERRRGRQVREVVAQAPASAASEKRIAKLEKSVDRLQTRVSRLLSKLSRPRRII